MVLGTSGERPKCVVRERDLFTARADILGTQGGVEAKGPLLGRSRSVLGERLSFS